MEKRKYLGCQNATNCGIQPYRLISNHHLEEPRWPRPGNLTRPTRDNPSVRDLRLPANSPTENSDPTFINYPPLGKSVYQGVIVCGHAEHIFQLYYSNRVQCPSESVNSTTQCPKRNIRITNTILSCSSNIVKNWCRDTSASNGNATGLHSRTAAVKIWSRCLKLVNVNQVFRRRDDIPSNIRLLGEI